MTPAPRRARRRVQTILLLLAGLYAAICLVMFVMQERLLFPTWLVSSSAPLPPGGERLSLTAPDGVKLEGVYLPPMRGKGDGTLLLSFAGNATNAQALAVRLRIAFPQNPIVAFHYRGYAPSTGTPGAEAMVEDAPLAFDLAIQCYRPKRVIGIGVSLGSGIGAALAARRPLAGLILVTPFDSLKNVARQIYWWLPVALLMRHDVDSVAALEGRDVPVALISAGNDGLVRPERTAALRDALRNLKADTVLPGATHNDIFGHPDFDAALRTALARLGETGR